MVERMSNMVAYYINRLVGPTISDLKVKNREKYHFHPRTLLREMIKIFLHLSISDEFLEAIGRDERSYSRDIFAKALMIARRRNILMPTELNAFNNAIDKVGEISDSMIALEDALGEIPDRYLDALLSTLMSDPVTLPATKMTVDRLTIQRHLMNNATDPFSRAPLTEAQLIEEPELKVEIEKWVAERKEAFRESKRALKEQQDNEEKEKQRTEMASSVESLSTEEQDVRHRTNVVNAIQFSDHESSNKNDEDL
jgi:ubiquitin conjugation factor E4 B